MRHSLPLIPALALSFIIAVSPRTSSAHCDTLDGPVVTDARLALERGDPAPVIKWVGPGDEPALREAFTRTLAVRGQSPEARELADMYFFETLVRLHRSGEGAPYTGLRPAGTEIDPQIAAADQALENGSLDGVLRSVHEAAEAGIRERFDRAIEAKAHAAESVEAGRAYVAAYVEFIHYVERLHLDATRPAGHEETETGHVD